LWIFEPSTTGAPVLTKRALSTSHGADPSDIRKVEDVFTRYGLAVVDGNEAAASISFSATVEDLERAFGLHLFKARHEGGVYRARAGDIHIPRELDGIVVGVFGLDTHDTSSSPWREKHGHPLGFRPNQKKSLTAAGPISPRTTMAARRTRWLRSSRHSAIWLSACTPSFEASSSPRAASRTLSSVCFSLSAVGLRAEAPEFEDPAINQVPD